MYGVATLGVVLWAVARRRRDIYLLLSVSVRETKEDLAARAAGEDVCSGDRRGRLGR